MYNCNQACDYFFIVHKDDEILENAFIDLTEKSHANLFCLELGANNLFLHKTK